MDAARNFSGGRMISNISDKKISIHITTYKRKTFQEKHVMNEKNNKTSFKSNKFVCAICLNTKQGKNGECIKKNNKSCPICQKSCDYCQNTIKRSKENDIPVDEPNFKNVQTSDTNVTDGLNLLNEVLTVFQNKKVDSNDRTKYASSKDVGVSTGDKNKKELPKLTISTFHYSIDDSRTQGNGKFSIICSCQPNFIRKSVNSMDLIKHKSCSIPQMKLEELKHSLKEKSRSKDAIEEVNRMFATVRRSNSKSIENSNRPLIRNGPRVLPVVKTLLCQETEHVNFHSMEGILCKCCQTCLSSGDSFMKPEYCHEKDQSDKPTYMVCCHYQQRKLQNGMVCDHCQNVNEEHHCEHGTLNGEC